MLRTSQAVMDGAKNHVDRMKTMGDAVLTFFRKRQVGESLSIGQSARGIIVLGLVVVATFA